MMDLQAFLFHWMNEKYVTLMMSPDTVTPDSTNIFSAEANIIKNNKLKLLLFNFFFLKSV
jgi:hypothetical protein